MEPRIQYAKTKDGVSIAFYTLGKGMPFVQVSDLPISHIQLEWQFPNYRRWCERLAQKRMLVRYDCRGCGLSERDVADFSLDAHVLDLETVIDRLGLESVTLFGGFAAGPVTVAYAARHPESASHLILWCTWARATDVSQSPQMQALAALMNQDWEVFTETLAHVSFGWPEGEQARQYAGLIRESITQEAFQAAARDAMLETDVTDLLPQVTSPTLVLQRRHAPYPDVDVARRLASAIPDARLVILEGNSPTHTVDMDPVVAAIDAFLAEGEETAAEVAPGGLATILFTDVEGSTALTQRLGDAGARDVLREHERIVRQQLKSHGGSEVKALGDGFMASFGSATRALECAIAMQRDIDAWNTARPSTGSGRAGEIRVRIGLNAGEPIAEAADLFGTAVNLAARIAAQAAGGEILVANVVRELAVGKGFLFADRGSVPLRGFEDPVRLFEVRWREDP
jgi:class 3 adenylate cyclase